MSKLREALPRLGLAAALILGPTACTGNSEPIDGSSNAGETLSPENQLQRDAARAEAVRLLDEHIQKQKENLGLRLNEGLIGIDERDVAARALSIIVTDYCDKVSGTGGDYKAGAPYPEPYEEAYAQYYPEYASSRLITPGGELPKTFTKATIDACSMPYAPGQYPDLSSQG